ncbi:hypothetical protein KR215_003698, partial [Drosophila sulfurigaster]
TMLPETYRFLLQVVLIGPLLSYRLSLPTEPRQFNPLNNIVENVLKQKPADTMLLLNRRQNDNCNWNDLRDINIPTIRLDEFTTFEVQESFNSEIIALVCMSELDDLKLLSVLAKDLHRMREARVIIWLQNITSNLNVYLNIIRDHANNSKFLSLLVMHSTSLIGNNSLTAYRLQPFPFPIISKITEFKNGELFPKFWKNFRDKTAFAVPGLYAPVSFIRIDKRTGKKYLNGFMDKLIIEFTKKYNINLKILHLQDVMDKSFDSEIIKRTSSGKIDLSMHGRIWKPYLECTNSLGFTKIFIAVPCGDVMGVENIVQGFKNYFIIILCVYLAFSLIETLHAAATCRIFGRSYRFSWANLLINLNSFRWVLGLSINVHRNRRSMSLHQIILIMSIFSMITTCFFNANVSTFFTKRPTDNKITNFDELRESGIKIVFDKIFRDNVLRDIRSKQLRINENQAVFMSTNERMQLMFAQNTSYAFEVFAKMWDSYDVYQNYINRKTLCKHNSLTIYDTLPFHAVLQNNSVYKKAFNEYIDWSQALGYISHWTTESIQSLSEFVNPGKENWHPTPLTYDDLNWMWKLIGLCYAISTIVFIGELCLARIQRNRVPRLAFV